MSNAVIINRVSHFWSGLKLDKGFGKQATPPSNFSGSTPEGISFPSHTYIYAYIQYSLKVMHAQELLFAPEKKDNFLHLLTGHLHLDPSRRKTSLWLEVKTASTSLRYDFQNGRTSLQQHFQTVRTSLHYNILAHEDRYQDSTCHYQICFSSAGTYHKKCKATNS